MDPHTASFEEIQAVKHSLLEVTEAFIDIASHIIATEGFERPSSYAEMFSTLAKYSVIPADLSTRMAEMAKFRNFLVHRYNRVDEERLMEIRAEDLHDVREFVEKIYEYFE